MDSPELCYDVWIEEALRRVIERALNLALECGLPGDHHFYITFKTGGDGVEVPSYLRAEHPDEMTIVLQHQFENLIVDDHGFSVTLRFKGKPEQMVIPYAAITSFADPSVNFGLQLKTVSIDAEELLKMGDNGDENDQRAIDELAVTERNNAADDDDQPKTGEIIALDSFRNKQS